MPEGDLSQKSFADGEQHLRHFDVIDRAAICTGKESGRKRAAQRNFRLENDTEPMAEALPLVQPDKSERQLQNAAIQQQNAFFAASRPSRRRTRKFGSAKR
jgi:hypothetical protein